MNMSAISSLLVVAVVAILVSTQSAYSQLSVKADVIVPNTDHYLLHSSCENVLNEQISWELYASMTYLNMAGYFDRPTVARSGFAKFFKSQSQEEYNHASKFIDYINNRNGTVKAIAIDSVGKGEWSSPVEAINDAINLEKHVYSRIQHLHLVAEQQCQDAHLTDFLEGYFFTEQVDSIRELQHMATVLTSNDSSSASVIEHMEDIRLKGEL